MTHKTMKGIDEMDYAFDPSGINPNFGGGPALPVGKHPVTITKSEGKPTKDNTGGYIELTCVAFDGPSKGGSIPIRLNLHNTSEVAVRIAKEQLAAICAVTGVGPFQNTAALHDKAFVIEVAPQANSNYTEVVAVFDMNGNEPGKQQGGGNGGGNAGGGANQGGGNGGFGGGNGGGASGTGTIPDQGQNGNGGGNGGFGGGNAGGGNGGGGGGWQQGGGNAGGDGGSKPGWGQR